VVRNFYYCYGAGHVCPPLVHYLPQKHSFSVTGVHRTAIVVRLLAGKKLIINLNQSIDEIIRVITNHNLN
jgi:predicted phage-related endonuclease